MDRPSLQRKMVAAVLMAAALSTTLGCTKLLFTATYLFNGGNAPADFDGLKGKKVAVVCRPTTSLQYSNANVSRELAKQVSALLQKNVPKIQMVESQKVARWADEKTWDEFIEVGKAMKADFVVGIDLEYFNLYASQTLYQGKANAAVFVYDCAKGGDAVFEKEIPPVVYPPNMPIPTSDRTRESSFRREFVNILADRIGRCFYEHDPYADTGQDAAVLSNQQ